MSSVRISTLGARGALATTASASAENASFLAQKTPRTPVPIVIEKQLTADGTGQTSRPTAVMYVGLGDEDHTCRHLHWFKMLLYYVAVWCLVNKFINRFSHYSNSIRFNWTFINLFNMNMFSSELHTMKKFCCMKNEMHINILVKRINHSRKQIYVQNADEWWKMWLSSTVLIR